MTISMPNITYTAGHVIIPAGYSFNLAVGAQTTDGSDQGTLTSMGVLGSKIKANYLLETVGKLRAGFGRTALGYYFGDADFYIEGELVDCSMAARDIIAGRASSEVNDGGTTTPNIIHKLPLSRATPGILPYHQVVFDMPGPWGQTRRLQFFAAQFLPTKEDEMDTSAAAHLTTPFKIVACSDPGAKAGGKDPIGYVYDLTQTD